jgi:cysteine desulfurase
VIRYFDYNATHPPIPECIQVGWEDYQSEFYNPSGITRFSLRNQGKIESVRKHLAHVSGFPEKGIIFTSTGTEANYTLIAAIRKKFPDQTVFYTSSLEHSSFYAAIRDFQFTIIQVPTDKSGLPDLDFLERGLKANPGPIGFVYATNESGILHPISEIRNLATRYSVPLVSDCMQSYGKMFMDFSALDGFSCSGHKIGGGMGTGVAGLRQELLGKDWSIFHGGNQENGRRAGTENLASILSFRAASEYQWSNLGGNIIRYKSMQTYLESELEAMGAEIVGKSSLRLPSTVFAILDTEDVDFLMMNLESNGYLIATGSSCKSRAREASSGLLAMGYPTERALRAVRISFGTYTRWEELESLVEILKSTLERIG